MLTYDPVSALQHYPANLSRFGQNPYGENLYRIVFAPSRRYLVVGEWPDGSNCAQWVPKYKKLGNIWVMEQWVTAEEFAKCSREQWNQNLLILGPWPARGEYRHCHSFELSGPEDANLDKLVSLLKYSQKTSLYESIMWNREDAARNKASAGITAEDMTRNVLPAFGGRPMSYGRFGRGFKTAKQLLTAREAGMPVLPRTSVSRGISSRHAVFTKPSKPSQEIELCHS